jgi:hypothetical protein
MKSPDRLLPSTQSVVATYYPGPSTQYRCNKCLQTCAFNKRDCVDFVVRYVSWWNPPAALLLYAGCESDSTDCRDQCARVGLFGSCCDKVCGPRNPSDPREGCCDADESCVDQNDPNSRNGCCPSNQTACGGKCCPAGFSCIDGLCTTGFPNTPPPPPPDNNCIFGGEPCMGKCCPIGTVCCGGSPGQPVCKLGSTTSACLN